MKVLVISVFLTVLAVSQGLSLVGLASQKLFNGSSAGGLTDKIVSEGTKDVAAVANVIKGVVTGTKSTGAFGAVTGTKISTAVATESESCEDSSSPAKTSSGLSTLLKMPTNVAASVADISKDVLQMPTNLAASVADISKDVLQMPTNFAESVADISNDILKMKTVSHDPPDLMTLLKVPANLASSMVDISTDVLKVSTDFADSIGDISKDVVKAQTDFADSVVNISKDVFKGQSDIAESMATISKDIIRGTSNLVSGPNDMSDITSMIKLPTNIAETVADLSKDLLKVQTNITATLKNPRSAFVDVLLKNFFNGLRKMIVKSVT